jgi:hypothetical protein
VASRAHPDRGPRTQPDELLWVGRNVYMPLGEEPSRFAVEQDFEDILDMLVGTPFYSVGSSAEGVAIEVPVGTGDTALIHLQTDPAHPHLGNGLLTTLKLRIPGEVQAGAAELASTLNTMEANGRLLSANFGAWCLESTGGHDLLAHARFTPNAHYRPGMVTDIAVASVNRAIWVAEVLLGSDRARIQRTAHEIVADRFGEPPVWN